MADTVSTNRGPSTVGILGVAFVVLKLTGVINWSWWWVLLPFYGGAAFFGAFLLIAGISYLVYEATVEVRRTRRRRKQAARRLNR